MVIVPKDDGQIRICIDMRMANKAIERENHPLPTMECFLPYIAHSIFFTKLDVENAFYQVLISEQSRVITTFIAKGGLFRYKRLIFGISCAPEKFQKIMETILSECEGALNFIDDVLIHGATEEIHDNRLAKVLQVLKKYNVTLNERKCVYKVKKLEFLGHELSGDGIKPTKDKVSAVQNFREPRTPEEVRSFLGLVNYVGKFIPDLATQTDPLRRLIKKDEIFVWGNEQKIAFEKLKKCLISDMVLGYYNVHDRTMIVADASPVGLGAVLIQIDEKGPRVISYASKSLSDTERRYCQTEKEALALVWAVERFRFYVFGKEFELITDHKPLEAIFSPKSKPCARIERWVLRLQSFRYIVKYTSGKSNIADVLSRLSLETGIEKPFDEDTEHYVAQIVEFATPIAVRLSEINEHSIQDDEIQSVKDGLYNDIWAENVLLFNIFKTELCFAGEILLRGNRIVIPKVLRNRILELAHEGHPGMAVMKRRLRAKVWWPKIDQDVERCVKKLSRMFIGVSTFCSRTNEKTRIAK